MDYFNEYYEWRLRAERAERLLVDGLPPKDIGRAHHIKDLETKNARLKKQVREMQLKAEEFNRRLYATGLIVNCTGCWAGRPFNAEELTEERVREVETLAHRLRTWWTNQQGRLRRGETQQ